VRASHISGSSRRPLPDEVLEQLEVEAVTAVRGLGQTDLLPAHINKGRGVRALAQLLSGGEPMPHLPLALAVGDSYADLTMLAEAGASFGPANSDQAVKASGARITSGARQKGLQQAVSAFLDHKPSRCASCRSPQISRDASLLLTAMSAGGAGRLQKLGLGLRLAIQSAR
jgi:haloacid dehalogenase-like hydrolase